MLPRRITLIAMITATIAAAGWLLRSRPAQAATTESAAPGQLTLVNRKGEATGLCPLRHTDVTADIAGYAARVTVNQEFINPSKEPIEAIYTFPLPNDAAVDDMTMTIGSRVVRGQVKRKEEAFGIYAAARASGQSAALLDQERPNIFTQQVANIMPGAKVVITIRYLNLLKYQDGQYEFVFPMVVGQRYIPGGGYTAAGPRGTPTIAKIEGDPGATPVVVDAHRITPPITPPGTRAGHDISLTVRLDAGIPIQALDAGLHRVSTVRRGQCGAIITLENREEIPNKDFILHYSAAGSEMAEGLLAYAPSRAGIAGGRPESSGASTPPGGYFTLVIQPPLAPPKEQISPKEMVFVIDQTGSQSGWPIAMAKQTMKYCVANMNPGDTFQLIGFNTALYPCFTAPVPNTPENVAKALAFLAPIEGNGGTDILKSVDYALNLPDDPDRLRIVCYMTDGYVGNDMQIIDYIQKHRGRARMFPFGVGNSVNRFLIEGMAREGRGAAEFVAVNINDGAQYGGPMPESSIKGAKEAAERFYRRIASPLLLDVRVDWNGLPVDDIYPKQIPDVFSASPIILKGRFTRAAEGDITIHGLLRGKPWSRTIHVTLPASTSRTDAYSDGSAIPTLWAREKIEDLQNQDWLGTQTNAPKPEIQEQIINTALEYHLMSQYTSFVAVEERVVNVGGRQRTLDVPVETPDGVSYGSVLASDKALKGGRPWLVGNSNGGLGANAGTTVLLGRAGANAANATRRQGGDSLHSEFGVTFQVLANPDDNSIVLKETESAALGLNGDSARVSAGRNGAAKPQGVAPLGDAVHRKGRDESKYGTVDRISKPVSESLAKRPGIRNESLEGENRLQVLKPEERRAVIEQAKLAPALIAKLQAFRKVGRSRPPVVEVQVWIYSVPQGGLSTLKSLGFTLSATITPGRLLLGSVPLDKLDEILKLSFVRRVEPPKFR